MGFKTSSLQHLAAAPGYTVRLGLRSVASEELQLDRVHLAWMVVLGRFRLWQAGLRGSLVSAARYKLLQHRWFASFRPHRRIDK